MKMRSIGISVLSLVLTAFVTGNAFYQKKQFYPSVVYITKSNASITVIYIQFFVIVLMLGKLLRKIFLGTLRAAEFEHLMERFWYALTETCLAFTVFKDDFNPRFVALFTILLFLKSFHWLAEERVDYMERSPVIGWLFHVRAASLLLTLGLVDYFLIVHAYNSTVVRGPTVQLVFGFEYAILITMVANIAIKYVMHAAEMRADTPWENKAVFLLYTELIIGLIKVILYIVFVVIMAKIYALPMFVFRPMFYTLRNFKKALNDVIMSRRAIRNMNTLYPDATQEELALSDNICIICREDMISNSKKLPCGHIFHTTCLRSWFQRQQTCPTCRLNILRTPNTNSTALPRQEPAVAAAGVNPPPNANQIIPPGATIINAAADQPNVPNNVANGQAFPNVFTQNMPTFNVAAPNGMPMASPFVFPNAFPFMPPFAIPPPPMPPALETLTDEELRALEGTERKNVEDRIKLLRNIQLLIDASTILMSQYVSVAPTLNVTTASAGPSTQYASPASDDQQATTIVDTKTTEVPAADSQLSINRDDEVDASTSTSGLSSKSKLDEVTIEDIGGEEHMVYEEGPGTSADHMATTLIDSDANSSELSEIRKRRLQKFSQEGTMNSS